MCDRDPPHKPKGYGFADYSDQSSAEAAIRNLNGREVFNRPIRVDNADRADRTEARRGGTGAYGSTGAPGGVGIMGSTGGGGGMASGGMSHGGYPLLHAPPDGAVGLSAAGAAAAAMAGDWGLSALPGPPAEAADAITRRLGELSPRQMYDILVQMKALVLANEAQARALLLQNPQLTRALFQSQLILGLVQSAGAPPAAAAAAWGPVPGFSAAHLGPIFGPGGGAGGGPALGLQGLHRHLPPVLSIHSDCLGGRLLRLPSQRGAERCRATYPCVHSPLRVAAALMGRCALIWMPYELLCTGAGLFRMRPERGGGIPCAAQKGRQPAQPALPASTDSGSVPAHAWRSPGSPKALTSMRRHAPTGRGATREGLLAQAQPLPRPPLQWH